VPERPIRVLLVDDEAAVRRGLRMQLQLEDDIEVVGEAWDGESALNLARVLSPDVIVMDIRMKPMDGITATERLCCNQPAPAVVIVTIQDDLETRARAVAAGARSFIPKQESQHLVAAIRAASDRAAWP
jgi:DNA-binding NarL/FixJ family response regulator